MASSDIAEYWFLYKILLLFYTVSFNIVLIERLHLVFTKSLDLRFFFLNGNSSVGMSLLSKQSKKE